MSESIKQIFDLKERLACITLDFERDYGDRTGEFNILNDKTALESLASCFRESGVPVSAFIATALLDEYRGSFSLVKNIAQDYHCHSHTHRRLNPDQEFEIAHSADTFEKHFGFKPLGYRAPLGHLRSGDIDLIKKYGFKFSASVFPSFRPGKFNNLSKPVVPFAYKNGVVELPFAVLKKPRYIMSLSYLKLTGWRFFRLLSHLGEFPNVVIFNSHLHDYIVNEKSFNLLPLKLKIAWGRNKYKGVEYFKRYIDLLKKKGYRFITMTELYSTLENRIIR